MFRLVSAVMNLSQLRVSGSEEQSSIDRDSAAARTLTEVLGLSRDCLDTLICTKSIVDPVTKQKISQSLSQAGAENNKDTLAKVVYSRLFDWLVGRLNVEIKKPRTGPASHYRSIGILDIFGFEIFDTNSFEQLCINFTNERLQHVFNSQLFELEMVLYDNEAIKYDTVAYEDNSHVIDLVDSKPQSVFGFLDEQCKFAGGTDLKFLEKVHSALGKRKGYLPGPRIKSSLFGIAHFAGDVQYDVTSFVEKNRNSKNRDLDEIMAGSSVHLIAALFAEGAEKAGKEMADSSKSVSAQFLGQLKELVQQLNSSASLYIRCIKPNQVMSPGLFESEIVCKQLRCAGMLEAIRIRKCGYPIRRPFDSFCKIYKLLLLSLGVKFSGTRHAVEAFIQALDREGIVRAADNSIQVGKTKVFLKEQVKTRLDSMLEESLSIFVRKVQRAFRRYRLSKALHLRATSRVLLQRWWRDRLAKRQAELRRLGEQQAARSIQRLLRAKLLYYRVKALIQKGRGSWQLAGSTATASDQPTARKEPSSASRQAPKHDYIERFSQAVKQQTHFGEVSLANGGLGPDYDESHDLLDDVESHPKYIRLEIEVERLRKEREISHKKLQGASHRDDSGRPALTETTLDSTS